MSRGELKRAGVAARLLVIGGLAAWLAGCRCPCECVASSFTFLAQGAPDASLSLVGVGDTSAPGEPGNCTSNATETSRRRLVGSLDAGSYDIRVAAPGYQPATITVALTIGTATGVACSCPGGLLSPNSVTLTPSDGGP